MNMQPPLGGIAPPLQCNRLMSGPIHYCGRPATWHIIWTADLENGLACDEHADEVRQNWVYFGLHAYDPVCSMTSVSIYRPDIDRCVIEEDGGDLEASESVAVPVAT